MIDNLATSAMYKIKHERYPSKITVLHFISSPISDTQGILRGGLKSLRSCGPSNFALTNN